MEKQSDVEIRINDEEVLIHKEMSLPEDHTKVNVLLLKDEIQKLIWIENPRVSIVYLRQAEPPYVFLYVYTRQRGEQCYSRITIKA